jgi:hypothetical protein
MAFAKTFLVGWDAPLPPDMAPRKLKVSFKELRVFEDAEPPGEDGEWYMTFRANDQWCFAPSGLDDVDDPSLPWGPDYTSYDLSGVSLVVEVPHGTPLDVYARGYDHDPVFNDDLGFVESRFEPPTYGTDKAEDGCGVGCYVNRASFTDTDGPWDCTPCYKIVYAITELPVSAPDETTCNNYWTP